MNSRTYIYEVRWVASQLQAMKSLFAMWHVIVTDLNSISTDSIFSESTRVRAKNLSTLLHGKFFLILFVFIYVVDILEEFKIWSQRMQLKSSVLADYETFSKDISTTFNQLKEKDGA